jgi:hypothetical protein
MEFVVREKLLKNTAEWLADSAEKLKRTGFAHSVSVAMFILIKCCYH